MRYQPEHKAKTRALVLSEAGKAIREEGPHQVSVASIMKRAGLTHGGFYAHFDSRDALLVAAIEQMFEVGRERWRRATTEGTPAQGLAAYIDWYLSKAHRDTPDLGCPVAALASDQPRLSAPCRDAYADGARRLRVAFARHLSLLGRPDALALASSALAELVGALSLARSEPHPRRSDAILAASRTSVKRRLGLGASA